MQVVISHKGQPLLMIPGSTRMDAMLKEMRLFADQLQVPLQEIEFDFDTSGEGEIPSVSMIFLVMDNQVIGSISTPEYDLTREFGVTDKPYPNKGEVVKLIAAEMSKAAHNFSNRLTGIGEKI